MNVALQGMLDRYQPQTLADHEHALKEIVQELALLGLWRAKFFEHAAFYGGTALRIFHRFFSAVAGPRLRSRALP